MWSPLKPRIGTIAVVTALVSSIAAAQVKPPLPDTTKAPRPDSTKITVLPGMRTEQQRLERELFDSKPNVGRLSVGAKDLSAAPKFFSEADLLRTIQLLPGVEARNDFSASMNVRGGESDQNLVLLDGHPIYNPFHFGGLFGTFIEPMVGRVDLFTGAFPAPYGNRLSSVLDVRSAEEARSGLHGTANVSLIASTASLGSSIRDGRGTWMLGGRRTYIDKAVELLTPERVPYDFQDAQGHFAYAFASGMRVAVTGYAGHDRFLYREGRDTQQFSWGNRLLGANIGRSFTNAPRLLGIPLGDSAVVEQRASASAFDADVFLGNGILTIHTPVRDMRVGGFLAGFRERHTTTFGYELATQGFRYESNFALPILPADSQAQHMLSASLYADDVWRPNESWLVDAGVRLDAVTGYGWWGLSPRLSAKYFYTPDLAFTAAVGHYAQWVRSLAREEVPIRPLDFWVGSAENWPVSRARHYALGSEGWMGGDRGFRVEAFLKTYQDLLEPNPEDDAQRTGDEFLFLKGRSYGFDVMLRQFQKARFSGWAAYTFAINRRTSISGKNFYPAQDRRHDLNLVGSWRHTRYDFSARYNFATGTPYSFVAGSFDRLRYDPETREYQGRSDVPQFLVNERNGARLPPTQRLDLSVTRNGHIRGVAVSPYLSIVNSTNAKNVFTYVFDYQSRPPKRTTLHQLSIVPTIGVSVAW